MKQRVGKQAGEVIEFCRGSEALNRIRDFVYNISARMGLGDSRFEPMLLAELRQAAGENGKQIGFPSCAYKFVKALEQAARERAFNDIFLTVTRIEQDQHEIKITLKGGGKEIDLMIGLDGLYLCEGVLFVVPWEIVLANPKTIEFLLRTLPRSNEFEAAKNQVDELKVDEINFHDDVVIKGTLNRGQKQKTRVINSYSGRDAWGCFAKIILQIAAYNKIPYERFEAYMFVDVFQTEARKREFACINLTVTQVEAQERFEDKKFEVKITLRGGGKEINLFVGVNGLAAQLNEVVKCVQLWDSILTDSDKIGLLLDALDPAGSFTRFKDCV